MSGDELVRWGLHLLQFPVDDSRSSNTNNASTEDCSCTDNISSSSSSSSGRGTENDEAIAIRLQEQFYLQDSKDPQIGDFFDTPCEDHRGDRNRESDQDRKVEDQSEVREVCEDCAADQVVEEGRIHESCSGAQQMPEMGNSHSTSRSEYGYDHQYYNHPSSSSTANENDEAIAVVLSEELASQYDGEVGRRLTHMESIPHVPKINGEIPSADAATLDHQRLIERLEVYGLTEHKIPGDGNCQFRALSDQFYRSPDHHMFVRKEVVKQLKQDPDPYEGYVPMKYSDYLKKMSKSGEWGDHVTLQAAADAYGMKICLITSFRDTCIIDIVPKQPKSERVIFLSFWAEVHYNSVYPEGEVPVSYHIKKKKHWFSIFG